MPSTAYVAFDPGLTGAIAMYINDRLFNYSMPICKEVNKNVVDIWEVSELITTSHRPKCIIESQNPRPKEGGVSAFTSGRNYGRLETAVYFTDPISVGYVHPATWYKGLGIKAIYPEDASAYQKKKARKLAVAHYVEAVWGDIMSKQGMSLYGKQGGLKDGLSDSLAILYWFMKEKGMLK